MGIPGPHPPADLIHLVLSVAHEFASVISSQVMPVVLVRGPQFEQHRSSHGNLIHLGSDPSK